MLCVLVLLLSVRLVAAEDPSVHSYILCRNTFTYLNQCGDVWWKVRQHTTDLVGESSLVMSGRSRILVVHASDQIYRPEYLVVKIGVMSINQVGHDLMHGYIRSDEQRSILATWEQCHFQSAIIHAGCIFGSLFAQRLLSREDHMEGIGSKEGNVIDDDVRSDSVTDILKVNSKVKLQLITTESEGGFRYKRYGNPWSIQKLQLLGGSFSSALGRACRYSHLSELTPIDAGDDYGGEHGSDCRTCDYPLVYLDVLPENPSIKLTQRLLEFFYIILGIGLSSIGYRCFCFLLPFCVHTRRLRLGMISVGVGLLAFGCAIWFVHCAVTATFNL